MAVWVAVSCPRDLARMAVLGLHAIGSRENSRAHMKGRQHMPGRCTATVSGLVAILLMILPSIAQGQGLTVTSITTPPIHAGWTWRAGGSGGAVRRRDAEGVQGDHLPERGRHHEACGAHGWGHHLQSPGRLLDRDRQQQPNLGKEVVRGGAPAVRAGDERVRSRGGAVEARQTRRRRPTRRTWT